MQSSSSFAWRGNSICANGAALASFALSSKRKSVLPSDAALQNRYTAWGFSDDRADLKEFLAGRMRIHSGHVFFIESLDDGTRHAEVACIEHRIVHVIPD